ncbi:RNA polymerase sigma factor [Aeromicrobium sp. P5_D10]
MSNAEFAEAISPVPAREALADRELLDLIRDGDQEASRVLLARHSYPAHRLARHLGQANDSEAVVSEAFVKVVGLLSRGRSTETTFRTSLFTMIRHEAARRAGHGGPPTSPAEPARPDGTKPIRAAYESLSHRIVDPRL